MTVSGSVIVLSATQPANTQLPILLTYGGIVIDVNTSQPLNAWMSSDVMDHGIANDLIDLHPYDTYIGILVTISRIYTLDKLEFMFFTIIVLSAFQFLNALG